MKLKNNRVFYSIEDAYKILDNINTWIVNSDTKASIILGLIGVLFINGIYNLILVLIPKLKINNNNKKSILYFGSICSFESVNEFKHKVYHTKKTELLDDLLNQVYINSGICAKKFNNYNAGLRNIIIGILVFLVFYILGILVYL